MPTAVGIIADSYKAPAGGGWTPANLGVNLKIWLDASDAATITAAGGLVSEWRDKSGNGIYFTMATGANQPSTGVRTINGRNAIMFDGTSDHLTGLTYVLPQPFTIAAVARTDTVAAGSARIFGRGTGSNVMFGRNGANAYMHGGTSAIQTGAVWETTSAHRTLAMFNGAASELRFDATSLPGTTGTNGFTSIPFVGAVTATSAWWQGPIGEIVLAGSVLAGSDLSNLETYLKTKWGTP